MSILDNRELDPPFISRAARRYSLTAPSCHVHKDVVRIRRRPDHRGMPPSLLEFANNQTARGRCIDDLIRLAPTLWSTSTIRKAFLGHENLKAEKIAAPASSILTLCPSPSYKMQGAMVPTDTTSCHSALALQFSMKRVGESAVKASSRARERLWSLATTVSSSHPIRYSLTISESPHVNLVSGSKPRRGEQSLDDGC